MRFSKRDKIIRWRGVHIMRGHFRTTTKCAVERYRKLKSWKRRGKSTWTTFSLASNSDQQIAINKHEHIACISGTRNQPLLWLINGIPRRNQHQPQIHNLLIYQHWLKVFAVTSEWTHIGWLRSIVLVHWVNVCVISSLFIFGSCWMF